MRLKGGDPGVFGRANEEIEAARAAGVSCKIVPGVTTALAAAAELGVSLSDRDLAKRIQFVTAHDAEGELPEDLDWRALVDARRDHRGLHGRAAIAGPGRPACSRRGSIPATPAMLMENVGPRERDASARRSRAAGRARRRAAAGPGHTALWPRARARRGERA